MYSIIGMNGTGAFAGAPSSLHMTNNIITAITIIIVSAYETANKGDIRDSAIRRSDGHNY